MWFRIRCGVSSRQRLDRSRNYCYCRFRLSANICSSWLIRDNTLSFERDKYWIPSKKRGDSLHTSCIYCANDITHMCILCTCTLVYIFIAHSRSGSIYTSTNLKFSNSTGNRSRDKNLSERSEPLQNTSGAYFNYF